MSVLSPLRHQEYRKLFAAQIASLAGTGLATIALGLLAHDLAGARAGVILGAVLAIKMVCYAVVAPVASALAAKIPRKTLLIWLDVVRGAIAAALPFVTQAWQVFALMSALYIASAAFTPAFQAMIPDILTDEKEFTKALSLSRLASDLESVASPILAAILLAFMSFSNLFAGTAVGFLISAMLVVMSSLPPARPSQKPFLARLGAGIDLFLRTPRLRGLVGLSLATAAGGAMIFVNTVVMVQSEFGRGEQSSALALAAFGSGSIAAALLLPRLLDRLPDRTAVLIGAFTMVATLAAGPLAVTSYLALLATWCVMGVGYSLTLTPVGRVLRRSSNGEDRPALFAAHFALSHACWLIAYPLAGVISASFGTDAAFLALAAVGGLGAVTMLMLWPAFDPSAIAHAHNDLPDGHPHLANGASPHAHDFVIDALHRRWPEPL